MLRKIKKAMLQDPIILAAPFQSNLNDRPITIDILSPLESPFDKVQKISLLLLGIPSGIGLVVTLINMNWTGFAISLVIVGLIGLIVWILKLRAQMTWSATWHIDRVEVEDGRFGTSVYWSEPLSSFSALKEDFAYLGSQKYAANRKVYGLFLVHTDQEKNLLLVTSGEKFSKEITDYYSNQLGQNLAE